MKQTKKLVRARPLRSKAPRLMLAGFLLLLFFPVLPVLRAPAPVLARDQGLVYDFIAHASEAHWSSGAGDISFGIPVIGSYASGGFAGNLQARLEDGSERETALETYPQQVTNGWIMGLYPEEIAVGQADELMVTVGFLEAATGTDGVTFEVYFFWPGSLAAPAERTLVLTHTATYDRKLDSITVPLGGTLTGKTGNFILYVNAGGSPSQDLAVWVQAVIVYPFLGIFSDPARVAVLSERSDLCPEPPCNRLPDGVAGQPYDVTFSYSGAATPGNWSIDNMPPLFAPLGPTRGTLTLRLHGEPRAAGDLTFKVNAETTPLDGWAIFGRQSFILTIQQSPTPLPERPKIQYDIYAEIEDGPDLQPIVTGTAREATGEGWLWLTKTGGSSETIRVEEERLPAGVIMSLDEGDEGRGTIVGRAGGAQQVTDNRVWLGDPPANDVRVFSLSIRWPVEPDDWRRLAGQSYQVTLRATSDSGVTATTEFELNFFAPSLPKLQISNLLPITQHGSTLMTERQTAFRFNYTLEYEWSEDVGPLIVDVLLILDEDYWAVENQLPIHLDWSREFVEGQGYYWVYRERRTLEPTTDKPKIVYLFADRVGQYGFLPWPLEKSPSNPVRIKIEAPINSPGISWDPSSILEISATYNSIFHSMPREDIKLVFYEYHGFTQSEKDEMMDVLFQDVWINRPACVGWGCPESECESKVGCQWATWRNPYDRYLTAIFPARFYINQDRYWHWSGDGSIRTWDANSLGEEAADEGYSRVIAICPPGRIASETGDDNIGVVVSWHHGRYDQAYYVAFVDHDYAIDPGRRLHFPVIAHELSHTYRFDTDIYGHYSILIDQEEFAYFDEINGGIIKIFKKGDVTMTAADWGVRIPTEGDCPLCYSLETVPVGSTIAGSALDIMDSAGAEAEKYWAYASYHEVADNFYSGDDPAEGLLVSMILSKNGTVLERPFQKIYNSTFRFPRTDAVGNFSLILYDRNGGVFRNYAYNISFYHFVDFTGTIPAEDISFLTFVEWSDNLGRIELVDSNGKVWFSKDVSAHAPVLDVTYPPDGKMLWTNGSYRIAWKGTDADGDPLWYTVLVKHESDQVWKSLASRVQETSAVFVPSAEHKDGNYLLQIKATDGVNTAVKVVHFSLAKGETMHTTPPVISSVTQTPPSDSVQPSQDVAVRATVYDADSGVRNVTLSYRHGGDNGDTWSPWMDVTMSLEAGNDFTASIPGLGDGMRVQYKILALDNADNAALSDNAGGYYVYAVVPEFPSPILMPLIVVVITLGLVLSRKRLPRKSSV